MFLLFGCSASQFGLCGRFCFSGRHSDGDGLPDAFELAHTDPPSATALDPGEDVENGGAGDGLTNLQEFQHGTDPRNPDTDGDGVPDGAELLAGTDPTTPQAQDGLEDQTATGRDVTPPVMVFQYPANDSSNATPGERLTVTFNKPIKRGLGRIFLRDVTDWSESQIPVRGSRVSVDGRVLTMMPPACLPDGKVQRGPISGWECDGWVGILNPAGDGRWYENKRLMDDEWSRGAIGSMRGPIMATFSGYCLDARIRREFGTIAADSSYTVSAAIGVRDAEAAGTHLFDGYTIRLTSGSTVLAQISDDDPPGPTNSVSNVGFSWYSANLPDGVSLGDPLAIEIMTNKASGKQSGYLDFDNVRVTRAGD